MSDVFWLSERKFSRLVPHLPTGTRGKLRVDDLRVISGIVQVLQSGALGGCAGLLWPAQDLLQSLCQMGGQGRLDGHFSCLSGPRLTC